MCMQGTLGSLHLDQVFEQVQHVHQICHLVHMGRCGQTFRLLQTLEDFIISILPPIIGDLDSTRVVVEVFPFSQLMQDSVHKLALFDNVVNFCSTEITFSVSFIQPSVLCTFFLE